jgi:esterase/lipase superfamily enzyme
MRNIFLVYLTLLSFGCFCPGVLAAKAPAANSKVTQNWIVVPVFYATHRVFAGINAAVEYSEKSNKTGLLFGVMNIAVPLQPDMDIDKNLQAKMLWCQISQNSQNQPRLLKIDPSKCIIKDCSMTFEQMVLAIHAYMKDSKTNELVIFAHGCCADFDTSMLRTAKIAAHMHLPILLYDWVSPRGFDKYLENETILEQTTDDFCNFLAKIQKLSELENITLIGHSMGTEFLNEALIRRSTQLEHQHKFKELVMSNGDTDAQSFLNHAAEFAANAEKTRIYISTNDDRLEASAFAHGGFRRLGAPGALAPDLSKIPGIEVIDITQAKMGHELPFWVVAHMHRDGNLNAIKNFQLKQLAPGYFSLVQQVNQK